MAPVLGSARLGIIDDHSRLCCHAQWYLAEGAEELCHGLCQALQKRALPRALMSDNGSAMLAAETTEGLARLGILHETTLPYAPFQNGKQEAFWNGIEGRLLPSVGKPNGLYRPKLAASRGENQDATER
jgi:transposase InsO family protein